MDYGKGTRNGLARLGNGLSGMRPVIERTTVVSACLRRLGT